VKLDAHQHFWRYRAEEYGWIGEHEAALKRDFLPANLAIELERAGFDGSVAVQARQSLAETEWLLELAEGHSFIRGVVGWLDLCSPDLPSHLERLAAKPKLRGVRHVVQDEPDDEFMLREDFLRGIGSLEQWDLAYDILIFPRHLRVARELVHRFPEQRFILDHMAKPPIRKGVLEPWASDLRALAALPNVACKVSGLVTEADWRRWQPGDLRPYVHTVLDAFGAERLMIGSDWPVCTLAASYSDTVGGMMACLDGLSASEQALVLGKNAESWYRIAP
jgi:L-fuconolactonase